MRFVCAACLIVLALAAASAAAAAQSSPPTGRVLNADGTPAIDTWVGFCYLDKSGCPTGFHTGQDGGTTWALESAVTHLAGRYYIWFTSKDGISGYYHEGSPGNFSTADEQWTEFDASRGAPLLRDVTLPERTYLRVTIEGSRGVSGLSHISACTPSEWRVSRLCLGSPVSEFLSSKDLKIAVPDSEYHVELRLDGMRWFYAQGAPGNLSLNPGERTRLPAGFAPEKPLTIELPPETRDYRMTLPLRSGANLVGWTGGHMSPAEICAASDEIAAVLLLDEQGEYGAGRLCNQGIDWAPNPGDGELSDYVDATSLGSLAWIWWSGTAGAEVSFATPVPRQQRGLWPGQVWIAWPGPDDTPIAEVAQSLGATTGSVQRIEPAANAHEAINRGDILQIQLSRHVTWMPPIERNPMFIFVDQQAQREQERVKETVRKVQEFFWHEHGVIVNEFSLIYSTDFRHHTGIPLSDTYVGFAGPSAIWLETAGAHVIAHEYYHVLQGNVGPKNAPSWLVEGSAEYSGDWTYTSRLPDLAHQVGDARRAAVSAARSTKIELRDLENVNSDQDEYLYTYSLGALAVEYLAIRHGGNQAVTNFWRARQRVQEHTESGWRAAWVGAFEEAFGIALDNFYDRFAKHRANGFRLDGE